MSIPSLFEYRSKIPELQFVHWDEPYTVEERALTDDEVAKFRERLEQQWTDLPRR